MADPQPIISNSFTFTSSQDYYTTSTGTWTIHATPGSYTTRSYIASLPELENPIEEESEDTPTMFKNIIRITKD